MIETSKELINAMRGIQTVSARINVLNSPDTTIYGYEFSDVDDLIKNNYLQQVVGQDRWKAKQLDNCVTHETGKYAIFERRWHRFVGSTSNVK